MGGSVNHCTVNLTILRLQLELEGLKTENALLRRQTTKGRNVVVKFVTQKSKKLRYWSGSKKAISTKVRRNFKTSPKKTGPQRKLSVKEELTLVLLKLRTAVTSEMPADLFDISSGGAYQHLGQVSCLRIEASHILAIKGSYKSVQKRSTLPWGIL